MPLTAAVGLCRKHLLLLQDSRVNPQSRYLHYFPLGLLILLSTPMVICILWKTQWMRKVQLLSDYQFYAGDYSTDFRSFPSHLSLDSFVVDAARKMSKLVIYRLGT